MELELKQTLSRLQAELKEKELFVESNIKTIDKCRLLNAQHQIKIEEYKERIEECKIIMNTLADLNKTKQKLLSS